MRIFVLTGAGVSAESGLGTFRDADGVWTRFDLTKVATPEGFREDPARVHEFYNLRRANLAKAAPNAAHQALARLQQGLQARGDALYLCTQNVDDLHEQGGATDVVHMHGELRRLRCQACSWSGDWDGDCWPDTACPGCARAGGLRPDIVWFGEMPMHMDEIFEALDASDLFVAIGTSGTVYPAAGFVDHARRKKIRTMEINLEPSDNSRAFRSVRYGPATETVPAWVESVLEG